MQMIGHEQVSSDKPARGTSPNIAQGGMGFSTGEPAATFLRGYSQKYHCATARMDMDAGCRVFSGFGIIHGGAEKTDGGFAVQQHGRA